VVSLRDRRRVDGGDFPSRSKREKRHCSWEFSGKGYEMKGSGYGLG
jgi:hypothetical protein